MLFINSLGRSRNAVVTPHFNAHRLNSEFRMDFREFFLFEDSDLSAQIILKRQKIEIKVKQPKGMLVQEFLLGETAKENG